MKIMARWMFRILVLAAILGIPVYIYGVPGALLPDTADAVSGATSYAFSEDDIKGEYVILLNRQRHSEENLSVWRDFFMGKDIPVMLEDLSCFVSVGDTPAADYAGICQARLPENQMTVRYDSGILVASKARYGMFDVIIMSRMIYDSYSPELGDNENVMVVKVL